VRDKVLHPYKTKGEIIVLYILIFTFLDSETALLNSLIVRIRARMQICFYVVGVKVSYAGVVCYSEELTGDSILFGRNKTDCVIVLDVATAVRMKKGNLET
jgi:hypothetical protein